MKKRLYCISKKLVWVIPMIGFCFLTGMGYNPDDADGPGPDNDRTVANKEKIIARWSFDASNPGRNSVSNDYHARVGRKVAIVPGITGNAIEITPSKNIKDLGIEIPHEVLPADLSELTFSAWVAPKILGENATIIRKEDIGVHGTNRLLLAIQNNGKFLTMGINCGGNYAECDAVISPEELCDGNWHLVAGTFDGHKMHVFLDGREIGSFERQAPLSTVHDFTPIKTWRDDIA
ncbi:MAG: LamG domain-containing protein, partial [Prevotellaceae bacterium]|nr:LamG domain-containing protein [Prevotellaceae bacterium]